MPLGVQDRVDQLTRIVELKGRIQFLGSDLIKRPADRAHPVFELHNLKSLMAGQPAWLFDRLRDGIDLRRDSRFFNPLLNDWTEYFSTADSAIANSMG
jgi:hypothetical protein